MRADRTPTTLRLVPAAPLASEGATVQALVETGAAAWVGESDLPVVQLATRLEGDIEALRRVLDEQFDPKAWRAYIEAIKEYRACLSLLGLTPSDRARLGVAEVKARSKLEEMMDRRTRTATSG